MICLETVKRFCKEYWKIENYQEAVNDTEQVWDCHHRKGTDEKKSRKELIAIGHYYDVHYSELIFLTHTEHSRIHKEGENNPMYGKESPWKGKEGYWKGKVGPNKGKIFGENNPNYKYHITSEELYDLYIVKGLNQYQIADIFRCSQSCIHHKLKKFNIKKQKI